MQGSNLRPSGPKPDALPGCANHRTALIVFSLVSSVNKEFDLFLRKLCRANELMMFIRYFKVGCRANKRSVMEVNDFLSIPQCLSNYFFFFKFKVIYLRYMDIDQKIKKKLIFFRIM